MTDETAEQQGFEGFRAQIDDFVGAISGRSVAQLAGESVLPSVALIEECYAKRTPLPEPWFAESLMRPSTRTAAPASPSRVLVTGASGFSGARLCERLHYTSDRHVRSSA